MDDKDVIRALTNIDLSAMLSSRMRHLLRLRYGLHDGSKWNVSPVAQHYGWSEARVIQIENKALERLFPRDAS